MVEQTHGRLRVFEQWVGVAFMVTGGLWLVAGIVMSLDNWIDSVMGDAAFPLALLAMTGTFVGLLGLYPTLAGRTRRLALAGMLFGTLSAIGIGILLLLVAEATVQGTRIVGFGDTTFGKGVMVATLAGLIAYPVGPTLFGIAGLQTGIFSRRVSYLLQLPMAGWLVIIPTVLFEQLPNDFGIATGVIPGAIGVAFVIIGNGLDQSTNTSP